MRINSVGIVGAGALGIMYGSALVSVLGPGSVSFIVNAERGKRYSENTFTCNGRPCDFHYVSSETGTAAFDLVIFAVKATALLQAMEDAAAMIDDHTVIISLLNGVTSEKMLEERFGSGNVLYCVAQGMDATKDGYALKYAHIGQLRLGIPASCPEKRPALEAACEFLTRTGIPHVVEQDILHRLWSKLMLNVGVNQVCMVRRGGYGIVQVPGPARDEMIAAMREVIRVAAHEGITLTDEDLYGYVALIDTLSPDGMPSMRQDGLAGRRSEVELFSGTIRRLGRKYAVDTPVNDTLYETVLKMEALY